MTLTKDRLVDIVRTKTQFSAMEAKDLVEIVLEVMKEQLEISGEVKISGFGKWGVKEKKSRPGRNPHTGEKIEIAARKVVYFHASEKLREDVNNSKLPDSNLVMAGGRAPAS